jgi:hypothetical protein
LLSFAIVLIANRPEFRIAESSGLRTLTATVTPGGLKPHCCTNDARTASRFPPLSAATTNTPLGITARPCPIPSRLIENLFVDDGAGRPDLPGSERVEKRGILTDYMDVFNKRRFEGERTRR